MEPTARDDEPLPLFGPDDPRTDPQRQADHQEIDRAVALISKRGHDGAYRQELLRSLRERRKGRDDLVQFDVLDDPRGDEVLVVRGQLLVRSDEVGGDHVRELVDRFGLEEEPVDCLDGRVFSLSNPEADSRKLAAAADALRAGGSTVSLSYVAPMGIVMKALGGLEPSHGPGPERGAEPAEGAVKVAVVDTGITERSDDWLTGLVQDGNRDLLHDIPGDGYLGVGAGHGSFVAGVVQQVAQSADLVVYKVLDSDGIGSEFDAACALVHAVREKHADVVNLSLGMETIDDAPPLAFEVALELVREHERQTGREVLVVAAAGNFGRERACWPAAHRRVVAVAGLTQNLQPTSWSSRGAWVDCSTIGEGIRSTYVEGTESPVVENPPDQFPANAWALGVGTSYAAPQVAGAVAELVHLGRASSCRQALAQLLAEGQRVPGFGRAVPILRPA